MPYSNFLHLPEVRLHSMLPLNYMAHVALVLSPIMHAVGQAKMTKVTGRQGRLL